MHTLAISAWAHEVGQFKFPIETELPPSLDAFIPPALGLETTGRKRKSENLRPPARQHKRDRRLPLAAVSSNRASMPPETVGGRITKKSGAGRTRTPSPKKDGLQRTSSPPKFDADRTPRGPQRENVLAYREALVLEPVAGNDDDEAEIPSKSPSHASSSAASKLSTSTKRVTGLEDVGGGIYISNITDRADELGQMAQELWWNLQQVISGYQTIPRRLWDADDAFRSDLGRRMAFEFDAGGEKDLEILRQELSRIRALNRASRRCVAESEPEAEWNTVVHAPLLDMVFGAEEAEERIGYRCMISDKIDSQWLPLHSSGLSSAAKQVDFGIFLADDIAENIHRGANTLQTRIKQKPWLTRPSINHTGRPGLRTKPIAISIETKTISRPEEEARVQLAIWIASQMERMRHFLDRPHIDHLISRIAFPLLFVQSEYWSIMFARLDPDDLSRIHIYLGPRLGDTSTLKGTYSLLRGLRHLREFVAGSYCKWWHELLDEVDKADGTSIGQQDG